MFSISPNGIIQLSRGDTWLGNLFINVGTELEPVPYQLQDQDALYFGVAEANSAFRDALICKKITKADALPGEPAIAGEPLEKDQPGVYGRDYYTRELSSEGAGYLNDGVYRYTLVSEIPEEHDAGVYFPLLYLGQDLPGYYALRFATKDTEHVVPGVYYYEAKLSR